MGRQAGLGLPFRLWRGPRPVEHVDDHLERMVTNGIRPRFRASNIHIGTPARHMPQRKKFQERKGRSGVDDGVVMSGRDGKAFHRRGEGFIFSNGAKIVPSPEVG